MHFRHTVLWAAVSLLSLTQAAPVGLDPTVIVRHPETPTVSVRFSPPPDTSDLHSSNHTSGSLMKRGFDVTWEALQKELKGMDTEDVNMDDFVEGLMDRVINGFPDYNIMIYQKDNIRLQPVFHPTTERFTYDALLWGKGGLDRWYYRIQIFRGGGALINSGDGGWRNWAAYRYTRRNDKPNAFIWGDWELKMGWA